MGNPGGAGEMRFGGEWQYKIGQNRKGCEVGQDCLKELHHHKRKRSVTNLRQGFGHIIKYHHHTLEN